MKHRSTSWWRAMGTLYDQWYPTTTCSICLDYQTGWTQVWLGYFGILLRVDSALAELKLWKAFVFSKLITGGEMYRISMALPVIGQLICSSNSEWFCPHPPNNLPNRHLQMVTPGNSLPNRQPNNVHHDGVSTPNLLNHCIDEGRCHTLEMFP
jgi:hypothetical protein